MDFTEDIKTLKVLLQKLEVPQRALKRIVDREKQQRESRARELSEYQTEDEIMDAYGYDLITEDERRKLLEVLERGKEYIEYTETPSSRAHIILCRYISGLKRELGMYEFEMLPPEEQEKRREAADKWQEHIQSLKAKKQGNIAGEFAQFFDDMGDSTGG